MNTRSDASSGLNALSTGTKIIVPAAILLLIDLFLSWQKACVDTPIGDVCGTASGWDGFWGVLTGLLTIVLLVWIGLQVANVDLSGVNLPVTDAMITLGLGVLVFVATLIKLLTIIGDESSWPAYVGIILAAITAYGAYVRSREVEDIPAGGSLGGPDTRPADAPAGTRDDDDVGMTTDTGAAETTGTTLGGGGATTSTSGTTATTEDVERDDVEPPPPSTTMPPAGERPPTTFDTPTSEPDERPPSTTSDDR
jgi:hypothetical protein